MVIFIRLVETLISFILYFIFIRSIFVFVKIWIMVGEGKYFFREFEVILSSLRNMHYSKSNPVRSSFQNFESPSFYGWNPDFQGWSEKLDSIILGTDLIICIFNYIIFNQKIFIFVISWEFYLIQSFMVRKFPEFKKTIRKLVNLILIINFHSLFFIKEMIHVLNAFFLYFRGNLNLIVLQVLY